MRNRACGLSLLAMLLAMSCSSSRCDVSGTVSWKGQPVPAGEVIFEPDPTKGNVGPQAIAPIKDGRFSTLAGMGSVSGPVTVTVRGFDGKPTDNPLGKPLFPPYESRHEVPLGSSTLELTVPADLKFQ